MLRALPELLPNALCYILTDVIFSLVVMSQTTITSSINVTITCENEVVEYRCVELNPSVTIEWNVEGFIDSAVFINSNSRVGRISQSDNGEILIIQVSANPLTTVMSVSGSITDDLVVNCSGSNPAVLDYISGG